MEIKPLNKIYAMNATYGLAGSFVGIFIPIYLLSRRVPVAEVLWFYFIYSLAVFLFFFLADRIARSVGLRKTVLIGYPFLFLYFFLLYTIDRYGTPIYLIALVNALQASLYWFPLHIWITNASTTEEMGSNLGRFFAFSKTIGIFAPFISGFMVIYFGFQSVFILAGAIYLLSALPLLSLPEFPYKETLKLRNVFALSKKYHKYVAADIFENLREDAEAIIWPIFVYLSFRSILSIGYIGTIDSMGSVLFLLLVGKYADRMDKRKLMMAGAAIITAAWIIRFFAHTPIAFYMITLGVAFFEALILIPLNTVVYDAGKHEGGATFILFREFPVIIGRIIIYASALLLVSNLRYIFVVAAIAGVCLFYASSKRLEVNLANS